MNSGREIIPPCAYTRGFDVLFANSEYPFLSVLFGILFYEDLRNARISGHYSKEPDERFEIEVGLGNEIFKMFPRDATAALLQQLFPSPVGLLIKKPDTKHFQYFTPEIIGKIFTTVYSNDFFLLENIEINVGGYKTNQAVWSLVELLITDENDKRKLKSAIRFKTNIKCKPKLDNILKYAMPIMSLVYEAFKENRNGRNEEIGYPTHIVEKILLTYMWECYKNDIPKLKPYFYALHSAKMIASPDHLWSQGNRCYIEEDFRQANGLTQLESLMLSRFGYAYYLDKFPTVVRYGMRKFLLDDGTEVYYSDCGDATLLDLFMMLLYNHGKGIFDTTRLKYLKSLGMDISDALINYFDNICPTPAHINLPGVLDEWPNVVNRLNKPDDKWKVQYVAPTPEGKSKEEYVDGYFGINTGLKNILMVVIKLFGCPKNKDGKYLFSMRMKTKLDCVKNLDFLCFLMSDFNATKKYDSIYFTKKKHWNVEIVDYTSEVNPDINELLRPTPKDGWTGLTLLFSQITFNKESLEEISKNIFEWHIDPRHYDFNRVDNKPDDRAPDCVLTLDEIFSSKMDSAKDKIASIDNMLRYTNATNNNVFKYTLENWLDKDGNHFSSWKNRKINFYLVNVLIKYWTVEKILELGIQELHDALVWNLVQNNRFDDIRLVLNADAKYPSPDNPGAKRIPYALQARALAQTLQFCSDDDLLKLRDIDVNKYCVEVCGTTLLHLTAHAGNIRLSHSLSKLGIDIDEADAHGRTPLHLAIEAKCSVTVLNLLNQNANFKKVTDWDAIDNVMHTLGYTSARSSLAPHPSIHADHEHLSETKKRRLAEKLHCVKKIDSTSGYLETLQIKEILKTYNQFNLAYQRNPTMMQAIDPSFRLESSREFDTFSANALCAKLTCILRTKYFESTLDPINSRYLPTYKSFVKRELLRKRRNFKGLDLPFEGQKYFYLSPLFGPLNRDIFDVLLKFGHVSSEEVNPSFRKFTQSSDLYAQDAVAVLIILLLGEKNESTKIVDACLTPKAIGEIFREINIEGFYDSVKFKLSYYGVKSNQAVICILDILLSNYHEVFDLQTRRALLDFAELLISALTQTQDINAKNAGYPNNIVENILLTYMWEQFSDYQPYYKVLANAGMISADKVNAISWSGPNSEYTKREYKRKQGLTKLESELLEQTRPRDFHKFFPAVISAAHCQLNEGTEPFYDRSETAIRNLFMMLLYDYRNEIIDLSILIALAEYGYKININFMMYFDKIAKNNKYAYTSEARHEWLKILSSLNKPGDQYKIKLLSKNGYYCIAPGLKNLLRVIGKLLGEPENFDMEMKSKFSCLINMNSLCYFFSENELETWNPNTYNHYWTVNATHYGIPDDQDICDLNEPLLEDEDWTGISFLFSIGSMARMRRRVFELHVEQDTTEVCKTAVHQFDNVRIAADDLFNEDMHNLVEKDSLFRIYKHCNFEMIFYRAVTLYRMLFYQYSSNIQSFKYIIDSWLEPSGQYFAGWRNTNINIGVVGALRKFYTVAEILQLNIPSLNNALVWLSVKSKNHYDLVAVLQADLKHFLTNVHENNHTTFSEMAGCLAYTLQHGDFDDLNMLLKARVHDYLKLVSNASLQHMVAASGKPQLLEYLMSLEGNVNARDKFGKTPLHYAVFTKYNPKEMVTLLLECGAQINAQDELGRTPLFIVADQIEKELTRVNMVHQLFLFRDNFCDLPGVDFSLFDLLIRAGADYTMPYKPDMSFLEFAQRFCNKSTIEYMSRQRSKKNIATGYIQNNIFSDNAADPEIRIMNASRRYIK